MELNISTQWLEAMLYKSDAEPLAGQELVGYLYDWIHCPPDKPEVQFTGFSTDLNEISRSQFNFNIRPVYTKFQVPEGYKLLKDSTNQDRSFDEDFDRENGFYACNCYVCGRGFFGHKRRIVCKVCEEERKEK